MIYLALQIADFLITECNLLLTLKVFGVEMIILT